MRHFVDYMGAQVFLSNETEKHIALMHSEVEIENIRVALANPDEVRRSSYRSSSVLYYRAKAAKRFLCVVVKSCQDGLFISSAMTTAKPKSGEVIYVRK